MTKRQMIPLFPPYGGRIAKTSLIVLFVFVGSVLAFAQTQTASPLPDKQDYNQELRTRTWSIYTQGGQAWTTDVWYQSINAKKSYKLAPSVGGGVDFTIRPWVRVGAEYLWLRYRREQRFSVLDTKTMPVKAYGNYLMNSHNAKLGVAFNAMELWSQRNAQWLNIWLGTGVGYTMGRGNEYGIYFNNTLKQNGKTVPFVDGGSVSNESALTITGNVKTTNRHERFNAPYIPLTLHFEADVSRQFTIGLKGEMDWVLNRKDIAPKNVIFALATLRYNFVPSRAKVIQRYYDGETSILRERMQTLQEQTGEMTQRTERAEADLMQMQQENTELKRQIAECQSDKDKGNVELPSHFVQFEHDKFSLTPVEEERLRAFAQSVIGHRLSLVAEASTPGTEDYNQQLSERRMSKVLEVLQEEGFALEDLQPSLAIGSKNGIPTTRGRRVTIQVEQKK